MYPHKGAGRYWGKPGAEATIAAVMSGEQGPLSYNEVVGGKYRVVRALGEGGMAVVYEAEHLELGQSVAIKVLREGAMSYGEVYSRFMREARASVRLRSEYTAKVYDVGALPSGLPFMVVELLRGRDLCAELDERHYLPLEEAVLYVLQACEALGEAHAAGIVHRDLKPSNLFLTRRISGAPLVKVLDFGIAKTVTNADLGELTNTSAVLGSPMYMAPEQMEGAKDVDARADIWSLGVTLYELVSGVVPFNGTTVPMLCAAVLARPPRPLLEVNPTISPEFVGIVEKALSKRRQDRWADVGEFATALVPFGPPHAHTLAEGVRAVVAGLASARRPRLSEAPGPLPEEEEPESITMDLAPPTTPSFLPPPPDEEDTEVSALQAPGRKNASGHRPPPQTIPPASMRADPQDAPLDSTMAFNKSLAFSRRKAVGITTLGALALVGIGGVSLATRPARPPPEQAYEPPLAPIVVPSLASAPPPSDPRPSAMSVSAPVRPRTSFTPTPSVKSAPAAISVSSPRSSHSVDGSLLSCRTPPCTKP